MRLHRLELQAFGPYVAPQRIDFDRLTSGGLFLLEGPTGAGKTTILDAITFALYGGLAGSDAAPDRLHSDFAGPEVEPAVTLEFSLRGVRYLITRVPEHRRPKRRGGGHTMAPMRVHLRRREGDSWTSLSSNKAEVGDLIDQFVGLNRAQFTQVILLPQGEFARFLRADDDARRVVLTRLFQTQLYDAITAELDQRQSDAVRRRRLADGEIDLAVTAAAEAAGLDGDARAELTSLPAGERAVRFKQIGAELAATLALTSEALQLARAQAAGALAAERDAARLVDLTTRLADAVAALRAHQATGIDHGARAALLDAARRAEPVRPLLAVLAGAEQAVASARESLDGLAPQPVDAGIARDGARAAADRAQARLRAATALDHLVTDESAVPGHQSSVRLLDAAAAQAAALVESLTAARQALPDRIRAAEASIGAARDAAADLGPASQRRAELAALTQAASRLAELQPLLTRQAGAARSAIDEHQRLVDEHQRAMDARLAGMAAELAAGLADGAACPVCGSAEHPDPARPGAAAVTAQAVAQARELRDRAHEARQRAEAKHAELDKAVARHAAQAAGHSLAVLRAQATEVASRIDRAQRAASQLAVLVPELADLRDEQDRLDEERLTAVGAEVAARQERDQARADLTALRTRLAAAADEYPSVAARRAALGAAAQADQALAAALDELATALDGERRARACAQAEALASGFASLELASQAVLEPRRQAALGEEVAAWERQLNVLAAAVAAPELAGLDPAKAGQARESARRAGAALALAGEAEQEARTARAAQLTRASRLRDRLADLRNAEDAAQAVTTATAPVIYLAGLAKGMDGHRRVALTTYVLRHWFEQVVAAANVRLAVMSSGRYELRRSDEGESKRQRTGLMLAVIDRHTGQERGPASLSGGEMFYTSLALALGLADVVRAQAGGVDTETLFIDEGFGSLDADTLDQVLGVIDELRDHGRAVGIVSHVADLRDRIPERLEVRRLPDGSSTTRVVA